MSLKSAIGLSRQSIICPASNGEQAIGRRRSTGAQSRDGTFR